MLTINEFNTSVTSSISTNNLLRQCIDLAIDGFLFRGVTTSDHYYRFSQSFPNAFTQLPTYSNSNGSTVQTTPKQTQQHQSTSHSSKHYNNQSFSNHKVPPLDLSSLNANTLLEQQPISTVIPTSNPVITIKPKKTVYSPKDATLSSSVSDRRKDSSRRAESAGTQNSHVAPNTPSLATEQSTSTQITNAKRPVTAPTTPSQSWNSPQQQLNALEIEAREIQERMAKYRLQNGRPNDLSLMTPKQIYEEKCEMQQQLLRFENKYSKPSTSEQKRIMKPLYDYYRQLKRLVEKQQQL